MPAVASAGSAATPRKGKEEERNWSLQQRQGQRWINGLPWSQALPHVDWTRYHVQILFVDDDHSTTSDFRARLAHGLLTSIAEWNGYGRSLVVDSCGLHALEGWPLQLPQASTLFVEGHRLALEPYILKAPCASFSVAMLDCYDLVVAMDETLVQQLLEEVDHDEYYAGKVISLAHFAPYCDRAALTAHGGTALLARKLREAVEPALMVTPEELQGTSSIARTASSASQTEWRAMVGHLLLSCCGLASYLMDACPDDLDEQWLS